MEKELLISEEAITTKIYLIRGYKVILDRDLAKLYGVETRRLKEQVRRNIARFPKDIMFELTKKELDNWMSHFATSNREIKGLRVAPFAFTEHGVLMLSSVLNSEKAIQVNIQITRIYTKMKEMLYTHKDLLLKVELLEKNLSKQGQNIQIVFDYLNRLIQEKPKPRKKIGFTLPVNQ